MSFKSKPDTAYYLKKSVQSTAGADTIEFDTRGKPKILTHVTFRGTNGKSSFPMVQVTLVGIGTVINGVCTPIGVGGGHSFRWTGRIFVSKHVKSLQFAFVTNEDDETWYITFLLEDVIN